MARKKIRILIADDEPALRLLLTAELSITDDMELVAEASNGLEAVEAAMRYKPDVVIMDIRMPRMSGIEATEMLTRALPSTKVVVLTNSPDDIHERDALDAGAALYLEKLSFVNEITDIIRDLHRGVITSVAR